jgi:hypothetical protein
LRVDREINKKFKILFILPNFFFKKVIVESCIFRYGSTMKKEEETFFFSSFLKK